MLIHVLWRRESSRDPWNNSSNEKTGKKRTWSGMRNSSSSTITLSQSPSQPGRSPITCYKCSSVSPRSQTWEEILSDFLKYHFANKDKDLHFRSYFMYLDLNFSAKNEVVFNTQLALSNVLLGVKLRSSLSTTSLLFLKTLTCYQASHNCVSNKDYTDISVQLHVLQGCSAVFWSVKM